MRALLRPNHSLQRGITLVDSLLVIGVLALVVYLVRPHLEVAAITASEDAVIARLLRLGDVIQAHREAATTDRDADGVGEFGTLGVMLGEEAPAFARLEGSDVWLLDGYYYALLLPDSERLPVPADSPEVVPDHAEVAYYLVAWPVTYGETGFRAYLRRGGRRTSTLLQHAIDGFPYSLVPPVPTGPMVTTASDGLRPARLADENWGPPRFDVPGLESGQKKGTKTD